MSISKEYPEYVWDLFQMPFEYKYYQVSPFLVDAQDENLLKIEAEKYIVTKHNEDESDHLIQGSEYYTGTTHWFNEYGFEVRRDSFSRGVSDEKKSSSIITRENGLIICDNITYFDTCFPMLPKLDNSGKDKVFQIYREEYIGYRKTY